VAAPGAPTAPRAPILRAAPGLHDTRRDRGVTRPSPADWSRGVDQDRPVGGRPGRTCSGSGGAQPADGADRPAPLRSAGDPGGGAGTQTGGAGRRGAVSPPSGPCGLVGGAAAVLAGGEADERVGAGGDPPGVAPAASPGLAAGLLPVGRSGAGAAGAGSRVGPEALRAAVGFARTWGVIPAASWAARPRSVGARSTGIG
jgi:hypothetical protein